MIWGSSHAEHCLPKKFNKIMRKYPRFSNPKYRSRGGAKLDWAFVAAICAKMNELSSRGKNQCHVLRKI